MWKLKREGRSESTIATYANTIENLTQKCADLDDPENVKDVIARSGDWTVSRKYNAAKAYTTYLRLQGKKWEKPHYTPVSKLPLIPTEREIDSLISGSSREVSVFLQLLKETGARSGEAIRALWTDLDTENNTIRISPEKGSNPRAFKLSSRLVAMLTKQPKTSDRIFNRKAQGIGHSFRRQRRRIAIKLENPRLIQIKLHTFRHWKATTEYHKTKDILHVKQLLGHKKLENTLIYTQLVDFEDDEFTCKVAKTLEEASQLIEAGFDYVTEFDGYKLFRKRK